MSVWTFLMGGAAIIGMLLSAIGVYLVYSTFQETKRTADAAVEALGAQRAWMTMKNYDIADIGGGHREGVKYERGVGFRINWENTGQSPALNVVCWVMLVVLENGAPIPEFQEPADIASPDASAAVVGVGGLSGTYWTAIVDAEIPRVQAGEATLVVHSRVSYFDVFSPKKRRESGVTAVIEYHGVAKDGVPQYAFKMTGKNWAN